MKHLLRLIIILLLGMSFYTDKKAPKHAYPQPIFEAQQPVSLDGKETGEALKINQVQIIASHNSYHLRTDAAVLRFLSGLYKAHILPRDLNPEWIDYSNVPLSEQLEKYGVRGLELDVWNDPNGGLYYKRMGRALVFKPVASKLEALQQPGFKLLHIPDFDFVSTNLTLVDAMREIKQWSDAHPNHLPVFINIETEVSTPGDELKQLKHFTHAAKFDSLAAENLDREVKNVFGNELAGVLTPDEVRGTYTTLEQAALAGNWPTLKAVAGKVIFIIDGDGNSGDVYKAGHPSLKGRAMFVYSNPGTPEAAFVICNDAVSQFTEIQKRVAQGYIVRTRSDDGTKQARTGDYTDMNAALCSWAQIVSTDYYRTDPRAPCKEFTNYHVQLPGGGIARADSISAPEVQKTFR